MSFTFRPARGEDLPGLLALERRSFERPWPAGAFEQELALPHAEILLAFEAGAADPVGYIDFWVVGPEASVLNVAVDPALRRRGLARLLLRRMEERAPAAEAVFLEVRRSNAAARSLYEAAGYEQIGIRKRYYSETGEDAIVLSKALVGGPGSTAPARSAR